MLIEFAIYGLNGEKDIVIPFHSESKVLLADNGSGKTLILEILSAVFNIGSRYKFLRSIKYEKIVLTFLIRHEIRVLKYEMRLDKSDIPIDKSDIPKSANLEFSKLVSLHHIIERLKVELDICYLSCDRVTDSGDFIFDYRDKVSFNYHLFRNILNCYLSKKFFDDPTGIIRISGLSSGEKQIATIFSQLLSTGRDCIVLIDEPERSLCVEWQRRLLPDMLRTQRCRLLLAATHSPFIFENQLAKNTVDLQEYIRKI